MQIIKPNHLAYQDLERVRIANSIIHNVTNLVTMQTIANVLLALGASPIMAHAKNELAHIVGLANALIINIGTLDENWIESIQMAQQQALARKIPIVFDPVGAGATPYRTQIAKTILNDGVSIIRGNASEIMSLVDNKIITNGVDAQHTSDNALDAAVFLSKTYRCTVIISGKTDIVISLNQQAFIDHGTPLFTKVTGMGCAVTAVVGAFAVINPNYFLAASHAMAIFGRAGEMAASQSIGCGSFYPRLLDALSMLTESDLASLTIKSQRTCL
jgi:hydroxyethylthiazole kinase